MAERIVSTVGLISWGYLNHLQCMMHFLFGMIKFDAVSSAFQVKWDQPPMFSHYIVVILLPCCVFFLPSFNRGRESLLFCHNVYTALWSTLPPTVASGRGEFDPGDPRQCSRVHVIDPMRIGVHILSGRIGTTMYMQHFEQLISVTACMLWICQVIWSDLLVHCFCFSSTTSSIQLPTQQVATSI